MLVHAASLACFAQPSLPEETPLTAYRDQVQPGAKHSPRWTRKPDAFGAVVYAFNALEQRDASKGVRAASSVTKLLALGLVLVAADISFDFR